MARKPIQSCYDKLKEFEAFRSHPYKDDKGVWTYGYGCIRDMVGSPVDINTPPISELDASALLETIVNDYAENVETNIHVPLNDNQFSALVIFTYNAGKHAFDTSTLHNILNEGYYDQVPTQLMRWVHITINGIVQVDEGLVKRRQKEIDIWNTPISNED